MYYFILTLLLVISVTGNSYQSYFFDKTEKDISIKNNEIERLEGIESKLLKDLIRERLACSRAPVQPVYIERELENINLIDKVLERDNNRINEAVKKEIEGKLEKAMERANELLKQVEDKKNGAATDTGN